MNGTKMVHTRAMALTPPRMTEPVSKQIQMPTTHVGMPKVSLASRAMELGVGLHGAADAKRRQGSEDGKEDGEPLHIQSALKGVHRTTIGMAVAALHTIFHSQQSLGIFRGHAEDACEPAPQHGTRTTQCHSRGHAHDMWPRPRYYLCRWWPPGLWPRLQTDSHRRRRLHLSSLTGGCP